MRPAGAPAGVFLSRDGDVIALGPVESVQVDVDAFASAIKDAWRSPDPAASQQALDRYGGDLLPEDLYEEWVFGLRTTLRTSYLTLLRRLSQLYEQQGALGQAIAALQRLVATEPLDEDAHAALIRLFALAGRQQQAAEQYDALVSVLDRELGTEPQPAARALIASIREGRFPEEARQLEPEHRAEQGAAAQRPHRLPIPVDDLVGREREIAELQRLLAHSRLVTLTGPGGVGKTRLALAVAHAITDAFVDGAYFVDLAPLDNAELVLPAIARATGVREEPGLPLLDSVVDALGERRTLLLIDNVEHVAAGAGVVSELLGRCPRLVTLTTSRRRLRLRGEQEYLVQPLAVPEAAISAEPGSRSALPTTALADVPAVTLFTRRARAVRPAFELSTANARAVVEICRRLDGLPLAIELAAARVRLLPPHELLELLDHPLSVLTSGPDDAPDRHRTLRATIGWSHDLLTAEEQDLFARLAVFAGGFTLDAAEWVSGSQGDRVSGTITPTPSVLDLVASLLDQSLLRQSAVGEEGARFGMLETIRAYAWERLEFSGEEDDARRRHAAYFLALAEVAEPELAGPEQETWLERLESEHDNLRRALVTLQTFADGSEALRLAAALWRFWWRRGYLSEGRLWLEPALAAGEDVEPSVRAAAHDGAGALAEAQGDLPAAAAHHEAALQLRRVLSDRRGEARSLIDLGIIADKMGSPEQAMALFADGLTLARGEDDRLQIASGLANLGFVCLDRGDHQRAAASFKESLELFRGLGDRRNLSYVLGGLGNLAFLEGDYAGAVAMQQESLRELRQLGDRQGIADAVADLGHAVQRLGDLDRAEELYTEALRRYEELGDRSGGAFILTHLGRLAHLRGDASRAEALLRQSLQLSWHISEAPMVTEAIEGLAEVACDQGDVVRCARLLGTASALRETTGIPLPNVLEPAIARCETTARAALGEAGYAAARGEGRSLGPEQVLAGIAAGTS